MKSFLIYFLFTVCSISIAKIHAQNTDTLSLKTISPPIVSAKNEYVILLHGFQRSSRVMKKIERALLKEGYDVININYPSTKKSIEELSNNYLKKKINERCRDVNKKISFVTHSMGAILVRYYLENNEVSHIHRVIMLTPPNKGSKKADFWGRFRIANFFLGPALKQLSTNKESFVNRLALTSQVEIGIIAGKYDRTVTVESTKLDRMNDFIVVQRGHHFIMYKNEVIQLVKDFLWQGKFVSNF